MTRAASAQNHSWFIPGPKNRNHMRADKPDHPLHLRIFYDQLYQNTLKTLEGSNFSPDSDIDNPRDDRFGLTLLLRPSEVVKNKIQEMLEDFKQVSPEQFYYRNSDIHVTVLSIISCEAGFNLEQLDLGPYFRIIEKSLEKVKPFVLSFEGLTASPSTVMVQGFNPDGQLEEIRSQLRENFKSASVYTSIDKRYSIKTAHASVLRFRKEEKKKDALLDLMAHYRKQDFGYAEVSELEFVFNDWYQRAEKVKKLRRFALTNSPSELHG